MVGMLVGLGTIDHVETAIATPATSAPENPMQQKLLGRWQTVEAPAADLASSTFIFDPTGKLVILMTSITGERAVMQVGYTTDLTPQPMHIDLILPGESGDRIKTIFEFTPAGLLRLELSGTNPGSARPRAFQAGDPPFRQVSPATTLRPDPEEVSRLAKDNSEAEGRLYASAILQAELAHYLEHKVFAPTLAELALAIPAETPNYRYELSSDNPNRITITAIAKRLGLKSFTGAVFKPPENGLATLMAAICQTKEPSRLPPSAPSLVDNGSGNTPRLKCAGDAVMMR